ncbi:MAG TPA: NBR1-Ig-like domain-containing protein [Anaerolineales bacterium]
MQATTPFETTIPLDIKDLPAGSYTVTANGVSAVFTLPVENPTPTLEPTSVVAPTSSACIDSAAFVADVTIPDNSILDANTAFTKTWRLKNTGSCIWDSSYLVSYISGMSMTQAPGYLLVPQGETVSPGQTVDISVGMTSPVENGFYRSNWGLQKRNGPFLPIQGGANGNSFYVKIKVNNGSGGGSVTAASISIDLEQGSGAVCAANSTYFVHAHMTADGPTTVSYEIDSSAGQIPAGYFHNSVTNELSTFVTGTLVFDQADTKTISFRFVGPYPHSDDITVLLWVNRGEWYSAKLSCQ